MLPVVLYNNMEGGTNSNPNSSFGHLYDESVILNCVRTRKKVSELPNCPVCSCTIRHGELETHLNLELEKLQKISSSGGKRKLSVNSSNLAVPGSSTSLDEPDDQEVDVSGCPGSDVYQRVHSNRMRRLRARRRSPPPPPADGECPVCNTTLPMSRLQRHALRCLKRTGASMDDDIPDTSSEEGSIDVENDEPAAASGAFGAEYQWCGEWRVRATALQSEHARAGTCVRRASHDRALADSAEESYQYNYVANKVGNEPVTCDECQVVDGDEDAELYGPPQYSPSRIAADCEQPGDEARSERENPEQNGTEGTQNDAEESRRVTSPLKHNGLVEASAETRIQALKAKIKELEKKHNGASESKCLICLEPHVSPAVSIQCWHVYCEVCWLQSLRAKKICPQCNAITTAQHLRRIYM